MKKAYFPLLLILFTLLPLTHSHAGVKEMYQKAAREIKAQRGNNYEPVLMIADGLEIQTLRKTVNTILNDQYEYLIWIEVSEDVLGCELTYKIDDIEKEVDITERVFKLPLGNKHGFMAAHVRGTNYRQGAKTGYFGMVLFRKRRSVVAKTNPAPVTGDRADNTGLTRNPETTENSFEENCDGSILEDRKFKIKYFQVTSADRVENKQPFNAEIKTDKSLTELTIKTKGKGNKKTYEYYIVRVDCHRRSGVKRLYLRDNLQKEYFLTVNLNRSQLTLQEVGGNQTVTYYE